MAIARLKREDGTWPDETATEPDFLKSSFWK